MKQVRTRFAPSPTGFMHVGNLRSALYAYLFAKQHKGVFILRIEDTDVERYVEGAIDVIYNTLETAGIHIDEGPNEGGLYGPYVQSERKEIYHQYAQQLFEEKAAYHCFCTKERLASVTYQGTHRYDKHCLSLAQAQIETNLQNKVPFVIRQNMPTTGVSEFEDLVFGTIRIENKELEDHVLIKSDGMPTYNFANVVDDHLMGITHVIRGNEYLSSTPKYNLLYQAFGWEIPQYMHLTPILKDETRKLSKRHGDANFDDFISKGYLPEAIVNYIALLGWSPKGTEEKFTMEELIERFSISGLSRSSSIFDEAKMKWLNGEYIKECSFELFMEKAKPYFEQSAIKDQYSYEKFARLLQSRIEMFSQIPEKVAFMADFHPIDPTMYFHKKMKLDPEKAQAIIEHTLPVFEQQKVWNEERLHEIIIASATALELKSGAVYTALRIALTATDVTPGGSVEIADILGKEKTILRLKASLKWLS